MLAAATLLMAGNAWAAKGDPGTCTILEAAPEGATLTVNWTQASPNTDAAAATQQGSPRFGTGLKGGNAMYIADHTTGLIYKADATGMTEFLNLTGVSIDDVSLAAPYAINGDEAGNLIFNLTAGSGLGYKRFVVLPAGETSVDALKLLELDDSDIASYMGSNPRVDVLGRFLGNILDGDCWVSMTPAGSYAISFYLKDGAVDQAYASYPTPVSLSSTYTAQPLYNSIADILDTTYPEQALMLTAAGMNTLIYIGNPECEGDDDAWSSVTGPLKTRSNYGFDWFELGGERYYVYGAKIGSVATWGDADFAIVRASDQQVVATYEDSEHTSGSATYGEITVWPNADGNSVTIFRWNSFSGAAMLTFAIPGSAPSVPTLYLTGETAQVGNWNLDNCVEMNYDATTDLYSNVITSGNSIKNSTTKGSWTDFNANAWTTSSTLEINKETELVQGTGNLVIASYEGDLTLKVDWTNKKITAVGTASAQNTFTVTGAFDSWNQSHSVTSTDETQVINVSAWDGGKFKVLKNGAWLGNGQTLANGTEYVIESNGDDMSLDPSATGKDITFSWVPATNTLTATWTSEGPTTYTVAITGAFNSWSTTANSNTTTTTTCDIVVENYQNAVDNQGEGFKVYFNGNWLGNGTGTATLENGVYSGTLVANGSEDNLLLPADAVGKTVTFTYAIDTNTVRAVWEGEVNAPDHVYIIGNVNGNTGWAANNGVELTKDGATFEGEITMAGSWFGIATELGTSDSDWETLNANRYGAATDGEAIAKDGSATFTKNSNAWNISDFSTAFENGVVKFTVDWTNMTVTITAGASGIEGIAADNAADAVYYNLQGVQVANPSAGQVYIRVAGGKASKILY